MKTLSALLCCLMVITSYAKEKDGEDEQEHFKPSVDERLSQLEQEMQEISAHTATGTFGASFAPFLDPNICDWSIDVEALIWHAKVGGVDWAILYDQSIYPSNGKMYNLGFKWDGGVRVGIAKTFKKDAWDTGLCYTYFATKDSSSVAVDFDTAGVSGSASGKFSAKLMYNMLDLTLGRSYFVSRMLMVHPRIALKNVWLAQTYKLTSDDSIDATNSSLAVSGVIDTNLKDSSSFWGIGPQVGMDGAWNFGRGFKMVSAAEGALLQSYLKVTQDETIYIAPVGSTALTTTMDLRGPLHQFVPYGRLMLGLGWGRMMPNKKTYLDVSVAYEASYFWRANQSINDESTDPSAPSFAPTESVRVFLTRDSEDICLYGFNVKVALDF